MKLNRSQSRKIRDEVDGGFGEQVAFTQALVRYSSERGQEHAAQEFMAGWCGLDTVI